MCIRSEARMLKSFIPPKGDGCPGRGVMTDYSGWYWIDRDIMYILHVSVCVLIEYTMPK